MSDFLRSVFGEASFDELALVALFFAMVLGFSWAPQLGEALGGLFEDEEPDDSASP